MSSYKPRLTNPKNCIWKVRDPEELIVNFSPKSDSLREELIFQFESEGRKQNKTTTTTTN